MFRTSSQAARTKRKTPNKLIAGFAALSATAVIAASGFAAATPTTPPAQAGTGYGGNNTSVTANIDLNVENSNNNIIQVIINVFR